jgi:Fe-S cluster biogenesis protein NfuA
MEDIQTRIQSALQTIRPYLQADGGDVELVQVTKDGIVEVRLTGACGNCPMSQMTLRAGIERALMRNVPEIRRVEAIFD